MKRRAVLMLAAALAGAAGCGTQSMVLGTQGSYLLTASDALAQPGEETALRARLQAGDLLAGQGGYALRFYRDGRLWRVAETDSSGTACVSFMADAPGDYMLAVEAAPLGFPERPPEPQTLLVACRQADTPMAVVDLDRTVVASGFEAVLTGEPEPMPGAAAVLERLSRTHTIVYLTHRPDVFGPKSKAWLRAHRFPPGPVLLSTWSGFLKGSGAYKSEVLRAMRERFRRVEIGIGDKPSDAQAYVDSGMRAILVVAASEALPPASLASLADEVERLPAAVNVVGDWRQLEEVLAGGRLFPPGPAAARLRALAAAPRPPAAPREKPGR